MEYAQPTDLFACSTFPVQHIMTAGHCIAVQYNVLPTKYYIQTLRNASQL